MLKIMPDFILGYFLLLVLAVLTIAFLWLYLQEHHQTLTLQKNLTSPVQAEKGYHLLHKAYQKAQAILGKAELEGIKTLADSKVIAKNWEKKYQEQLNQAVVHTQKELDKDLNKVYQQFTDYLEHLKTKGEQAQLLQTESLKQQTQEVLERFENTLATFLTSAEQKSLASIEKEIQSAKEYLRHYQQEQMKIVEENIVDILDQTLAGVLSKKLTLTDHVDLIYESLEKAKKELFLTPVKPEKTSNHG